MKKQSFLGIYRLYIIYDSTFKVLKHHWWIRVKIVDLAMINLNTTLKFK